MFNKPFVILEIDCIILSTLGSVFPNSARDFPQIKCALILVSSNSIAVVESL